MFSGEYLHREVAQVCRVLAAYGMFDLWGHVSVRVPDSRLVVVTPRFGVHCTPRTVTEADLLVTDETGRLVHGHGALPIQFHMDLAIYRQRKDTAACIFSAPRKTMLFGMCRKPLKPIMHAQAELAARIGWIEDEGLCLEPVAGERSARSLQDRIACHQPGVGLMCAGSSLLDALFYTYSIEYLAQANSVAAHFGDLRVITDAEMKDLIAQKTGGRPGASGSDLYAELFAAADPGPLPHPWVQFTAERTVMNPVDEIKAKLAFTSRILWDRGTLVTFLEHVSHRIPGTDRWLMTPAKPFNLMEPEDMTTLDSQANWLTGPKPRPFKWFHRDILTARPDVMAIVHTHEIYGRVYALAGDPVPPVFRNGLGFAGETLPCFQKPDLIFGEEPRRATVAALGNGHAVHELAHGTDYVAATIEEATVDAIQREELLAAYHEASRLGNPQPLHQQTQADILRVGPTAVDWWWYYAGEVGHPVQSVAGI